MGEHLKGYEETFSCSTTYDETRGAKEFGDTDTATPGLSFTCTIKSLTRDATDSSNTSSDIVRLDTVSV
jgi:hypothetical protein